MHQKKVVTAGKRAGEAEKALILLHGRGANAADILGLASHLAAKEFAVLAPEASNRSWYPYSFLAPPPQNEPWLSSAIQVLDDLVSELADAGISSDRTFFAGFSQGACLTLEFVTRSARKWGGVVAFTGGLIGDRIYPERYRGDFAQTPVFIGSGAPDPHVPVERAYETEKILRAMRANVLLKLYDGIGHTIVEDEIVQANAHVFR